MSRTTPGSNCPIADEQGRLRHRRGVTDQPGLYFLGLQWQHTRGSALLGLGSDDARYIAQHITANRKASQARPLMHGNVRPWRRP